MTDVLFIGVLSAVVSLVASTLGLGGAVLLIPAYLFLPQVFGLGPISMHTAAGITPVQICATSLVAVLLHHRRGAVDGRTVILMGVPIVVGAFSGAFLSGSVPAEILVLTFAVMALAGAALIFLNTGEPDTVADGYTYNRMLAVSIAFFVGFLGGMAGAPGAFIISPLMMTVLRIPTRVSIGSTLGIVLLAALSTTVGKYVSGQIHYTFAAAAVLGSVPGTITGTLLSHRLSTKTIRRVLAVLIAAIGFSMILEVTGILPGFLRH